MFTQNCISFDIIKLIQTELLQRKIDKLEACYNNV